ncbi:MAG: anti-sigma factor antagonist [Anaerolineae bacterium]|nr:anti-sigma factor antagonist [Anaerolineae bacterium]
MLDVHVSRLGQIGIIEITGRLDSLGATVLERTLTAEMFKGNTRLILDCANVEYISSSGLKLLKNLYQLQGEVRLSRPSERVRDVLQIIGLDNVFQLYDTRLAAIHAVSPVVNAHTHLELSWLAEYLPPITGSSFVDWMGGLVEHILRMRQGKWEPVYRQAVEAGIEALIASGTTVVGDISSTGMSIEPLLESGLRGIVFVEILGFTPDHATRQLAWARGLIEKWRPHERNGMRIGLGLHAPYSVHPELWKNALDYARAEALPLTIHVAESLAEYAYLTQGRGDFVDEYYTRLDAPTIPPPGVSPVRYLEDIGALALKPLLAHAIQVDADDIRRIRDSGAAVVHCPRSNLRLQCGKMPLVDYLAAGVPVYLGTDSLASSPSLNVFDEAETAAALHYGEVTAAEIEALLHQPLPV